MMRFIILAAIVALIYHYGKQFLSPSTSMSANEAAKLLDVAPGADPEAILAAHRRLIAKVHPDAGGSAELAARVNQARDTLLQQIRR
jgi:DnaJ homolog subfamily C member 19